jgi:hypothetical protein
VLQCFSFFKARSTLFHRPLVDTRPPALLAVVLQFYRCLLRPKCSLVTGAWSSHARVFFTPWAACDGHVSSLLPCLVVFGGLWCSAVAEDLPVPARVLYLPSPGVLSFDDSFCFGRFLVFDYRLYLIVCSVLDLAWSLLLSTDYL